MSSLLKVLISIILKKRSIVFLGRAGMNCNFNGKKYFIDSEMLVGEPAEIVIYSKSIYLVKRDQKFDIDDITKAHLLRFVIEELRKLDIKAEIV